MNLDWLLGFIEGEGCFCIGIQKHYKKRLYPHLMFTITNKNQEILVKIRNFLLENNIESEVTKTREHLYFLQLQNRKNCTKLINMLSMLKWHTEKYEDFVAFKEANKIIINKFHYTKEGMIRILELRNRKHYKHKGAVPTNYKFSENSLPRIYKHLYNGEEMKI